jgi:hypothetical protein
MAPLKLGHREDARLRVLLVDGADAPAIPGGPNPDPAGLLCLHRLPLEVVPRLWAQVEPPQKAGGQLDNGEVHFPVEQPVANGDENSATRPRSTS